MQTTSATRKIGWIATILVVIGALNWALVGLFSFDLVAAIFGTLSPLSRIIYVLVGAAGLYLIFFTRSLEHDAAVGHPRRAVST